MKKQLKINLILVALLLSWGNLFAQEQVAKMTLNFVKEDSLNICKVAVTSNDAPVKDVEVKLYVKRLFSLLPIGSAVATDESGVASFEFPNDIPADLNGKLTVYAKIEDDENFGSVETQGEVDWGTPRQEVSVMERSLAGSRGNAPIYFIVVSNLIIIGIWGTLLYVVLQLFKIRKISRHLLKNK